MRRPTVEARSIALRFGTVSDIKKPEEYIGLKVDF